MSGLPSSTLAPLAYTVNELCLVAGIGRTKLYEDLKAGRLYARKHGKTTLILESDARRWLESLPAAQLSRQQTAEVASAA
jgi:excisionase family DNA binding protein